MCLCSRLYELLMFLTHTGLNWTFASNYNLAHEVAMTFLWLLKHRKTEIKTETWWMGWPCAVLSCVVCPIATVDDDDVDDHTQ